MSFKDSAPLECIQERDHRGAIQAHGTSKLALSYTRVRLNERQHTDPPRRDPQGPHVPPEVAKYRELREPQLIAEQAGENAVVERRAAFAPFVPVRWSLQIVWS